VKILHINTLDDRGGAAQFAMDFVEKSGLDCSMLVKIKNGNSAKVTEFPKNTLDKTLFFLDNYFFKPLFTSNVKELLSITEKFNDTYRKLTKTKAYQEADIIHLHNIHGGYFNLDALINIAKEKKIVYTLHEMWAFTGGEAYTFEDENYKIGVGKTPYGKYYPPKSTFIDNRQYYLERKKVIYEQIADNITFVPNSYWLENCIRESYVKNSRMKIKTIRNCIDTKLFYNKEERTWQKPRLLIFNSNDPFKGMELFGEVLPNLTPNFDIYVVGDHLESDSKMVHVPMIDDRKELANLYNSVDILVFPSKAEAFGLIPCEAKACGVCVIGSDIGGINEQLHDGTGVLFSLKDKNELAEKINYYTANLDEAREIGRKGEESVQRDYDVVSMYDAYSQLYQDILK